MLQTIVQSPQFKPSLLLAGGILLGIESLFLSQSFDAATLVLDGEVTGWRVLFSHFGSLAKLMLVILFAIGLLLQHKFKRYWPQLCGSVSEKRFLWMLPVHLLCYAALYYCTFLIYEVPENAQTLPAWLYGLWLFALAATLFSWLVMLIDPRWLFNFVQHEQLALALGIIAGLAVWALSMWTQRFWGPLSELTFYLSATVLYAVYGDTMVVDAAWPPASTTSRLVPRRSSDDNNCAFEDSESPKTATMAAKNSLKRGCRSRSLWAAFSSPKGSKSPGLAK